MSKEINKLEPAKLPGRGVSRRLFTDTFNRMLLENDGEMLRKIGEKLKYFVLHDAITLPDFIMCVKFLSERTDGRPAQSVEIVDSSENLPSADIFKLAKVLKAKDE